MIHKSPGPIGPWDTVPSTVFHAPPTIATGKTIPSVPERIARDVLDGDVARPSMIVYCRDYWDRVRGRVAAGGTNCRPAPTAFPIRCPFVPLDWTVTSNSPSWIQIGDTNVHDEDRVHR